MGFKNHLPYDSNTATFIFIIELILTEATCKKQRKERNLYMGLLSPFFSEHTKSSNLRFDKVSSNGNRKFGA